MRILRIGRKDDLTRKIVAVEYNSNIYDDSGSLEPPPSPAAIDYVRNLRAEEVWGGLVGTSIAISWTGFAMRWYVKYKTGSSSWFTLVDGTSQCNAFIQTPTYNVQYTINVSPTPNPAEGDNVTITPTGKTSVSSADGAGMVIDGDGLRVYSSDGTETYVQFYNDGEPPELSSPSIKIQTGGAIQTAEGVGDGVTNAAGIYIDPTGIYACEAGQVLASANVRILSDGSAYFAGTITALAGDIGGWDIESTYLAKDTGTEATSAGLAPYDFPFYAGASYALRATAPFRVQNDGTLYASSAYISGALQGGTIDIGGADASSFHVNIAGDMWLGSDDFNTATFSVTSLGVVKATSGTIGGFTLTNTALTSGSFSINSAAKTITLGTDVVIDGTNLQIKLGGDDFVLDAVDKKIVIGDVTLESSGSVIKVGDPSSAYIIIDGANKIIQSSDFTAGVLGHGWYMGVDRAEFQNIYARGMISTAVFRKENVSAIGGKLLISKAGTLSADITGDATTITLDGDPGFEVGEILIIKDEHFEEWLQITDISSAPTYTVTRDLRGTYA